jgi:protein-tyrosine-phosphatase
MPAILFVCTANQIRSPLAAAIFKQILEKEGLANNVQVESAGSWAGSGAPVLSGTLAAARALQVDLSAHRSRAVSAELIHHADLVLTMEHRQKEALCYEFPNSREKIFMLSEMSGNQEDIPDPIGGEMKEYLAVAQRIRAMLLAGKDEIKKRANVSSAESGGQTTGQEE